MRTYSGLIIILIAVSTTISGCANLGVLSEGRNEMAQSPITERPSGQADPGRIVWHDLVTHDIQSAGRFYQQLFGWEIKYQDRYAVVRNHGKLIAGMLQIDPPQGKTRDGVWIPTVSVEDVDAAADRVTANGGSIRKGPLDMMRRGRAVLISDPQGADLVMLRSKDGDPVEAETAVGDWLWDEIWTQDPAKTGAFYKAVLGYQELVAGEKYGVFVTGDEWRSGMRHVDDDIKHRLWVPVVRVADPEKTAERVEALGGVVWITPDEAPRKGETALIGDPTGALLLIQRWPPRVQEGGA